MTFTPEEAKTKWCSYGREATVIYAWDGQHHAVGFVAVNRLQGGEPLTMCLADRCEHWERDGDRGHCGRK